MVNKAKTTQESPTTDTPEFICHQEYDTYKHYVLDLKFWLECVLLSIIGTFGFFGNIITFIVLKGQVMKYHIFNALTSTYISISALKVQLSQNVNDTGFDRLRSNSLLCHEFCHYWVHACGTTLVESDISTRLSSPQSCDFFCFDFHGCRHFRREVSYRKRVLLKCAHQRELLN